MSLRFHRSATVCAAALVFVATATTGCERTGSIGSLFGGRTALAESIATRAPNSEIPAVRAHYESADYAPLWADETGITARGDSLLQRLCDSGYEGLRPEDYDFTRLDAAQARLDGGARDSSSADALAQLDIALSEAFVAYATDLIGGRIKPADLGGIWRMQRDSVDARPALDAVATSGLSGAVQTLYDQHKGYGPLRSALSAHRRIAVAGGWGTVSGTGDAAGMRRRLAASGDLADTTAGADLGAAVRRFQMRHGIDTTGTPGKATVDAMNVPVEARIATIEANLERLRWMPGGMGDTYVFVNVPAFRLWAYEGGKEVMTMPVIVGDEANNTPVFADTMQYLVFAPYWNIPQSIQPEVLAKGNLDARGFEREGPTGLRQRPGPNNALGNVKFIFPNDLNIYLHDTPGKTAFDRSNRSLSHGCVRVAEPERLATWALGPNGGWDVARVSAAMDSTEEQKVPLTRKIPVFLAYLTAWAEDDGTVNFRDDIYGHDDKVIAALARDRRTAPAATCRRTAAPATPPPASAQATPPADARRRG